MGCRHNVILTRRWQSNAALRRGNFNRSDYLRLLTELATSFGNASSCPQSFAP
jgi:hypothetical protein